MADLTQFAQIPLVHTGNSANCITNRRSFLSTNMAADDTPNLDLNFDNLDFDLNAIISTIGKEQEVKANTAKTQNPIDSEKSTNTSGATKYLSNTPVSLTSSNVTKYHQ